MPHRLAARNRFLFAFGPTAIVLVLGVFVALGFRDVRRHRQDVARTQAVLENAAFLLQRLTDAETGQRGYVITADSSYLNAYIHARRDVKRAEHTLRGLVHGDAVQLARVDTLGAVADRRLEILTRRVEIRNQFGFDSARAAIAGGGGKFFMDKARQMSRELRNAEEQRLAAQSDEEARGVLLLVAVILVGTLVAAWAAWVLNRALLRYAAVEAEHATELARQNAQLEEQAVELELQKQQLEDQAVELEAANEELQVTTEELAERTAVAEELREVAEEANRAKSEFLAMMSHELRTPLNAIAGYVDLMEAGVRGPLTDTQAEDLRRIRTNGQHLLSIINDVLSFARLEAGEVPLQLAPLPIAACVGQLHQLVAPMLDARGLSYQVVTSCGTGGRCEALALADEERLRQVLLNLLTNAIKFTEPGGQVRVTCGCSDREVTVAVTDTGIGIPPERLSEVFDPFVQVSRHRWGSREGIGLGLAISRDLARRMGGDLDAVSEEGKGSTFTLRLPRAVAAAPALAFPMDQPAGERQLPA